MKKISLLFAFTAAVSLVGCKRINLYEIKLLNSPYGLITEYVPEGYYPTLNGYTAFYEDIVDPNRYYPSLQSASQDMTYEWLYKITLEHVPNYNEPIEKYFRYGDQVDFSEYGINVADYGIYDYVYYDETYTCTTYVTVNLLNTPYGTITKNFNYGEQISFTDYGFDNLRFSDAPIYASQNLDLEYRYAAYLYDYNGNYVATKYVSAGNIVDFSDYDYDWQQYSNYEPYIYSDTAYYIWRYKVTFTGGRLEDGTFAADYTTYADYGSYVYYPNYLPSYYWDSEYYMNRYFQCWADNINGISLYGINNGIYFYYNTNLAFTAIYY